MWFEAFPQALPLARANLNDRRVAFQGGKVEGGPPAPPPGVDNVIDIVTAIFLLGPRLQQLLERGKRLAGVKRRAVGSAPPEPGGLGKRRSRRGPYKIAPQLGLCRQTSKPHAARSISGSLRLLRSDMRPCRAQMLVPIASGLCRAYS